MTDTVDGNAPAADVPADSAAAGQRFVGEPLSTAPHPPTPASLETIGSGQDAVVLKVSQDAFRGDARYTVSIDGVQVDGTLTAGALHSLGEGDTVTVLGNFTPGQHTVAVDFLNDAWAGTPETDRNLYVEGVSFNRAPLPNSAAALLSGGAQTVVTFSIAPLNLVGTDGPDRLQESLEPGDVFWGGSGADTFAFGVGVTLNPGLGEVFAGVLGTGVGSGARDVILDFQHGEDAIDLSAALQVGRRFFFVDEAFRFIGTAGFSGTPEGGGTAPPELRYEVSGGGTIVQMDGSGLDDGIQFRGDGKVDAEIELVGVFSLKSGDLIL